MRPGRAAAVLGALAVGLVAVWVTASVALVRTERAAFRARAESAVRLLALQAASGDPAAAVRRSSRRGQDACWQPPAHVPVAGPAGCAWLQGPSGLPPGVPPAGTAVVVTARTGAGVAGLRVGADPLRADIATDRAETAAVEGLVLVVVAGLVLTLSRDPEVPALADLGRATSALASGDLGVRAAAVGSPAEQAVAADVNALADRLQVTVERQRTFVADAAHQLRNPLLALQLRLENLEPHVAEAGLASHRRLGEQVERLSRTLDELSALARDHEAAPEPQLVDVLAVVSERAQAWVPLAHRRRVVLRQRLPRAATVVARAGALEQALDVVLDNALKHAPGGSEVELLVVPSATHVEVRIEDRGPGLPAPARDTARARGWQADPGGSGSGLGLTIASLLLASSSGSLTLQERPGGGLRAVLRLPTPAPELSGPHRRRGAGTSAGWATD